MDCLTGIVLYHYYSLFHCRTAVEAIVGGTPLECEERRNAIDALDTYLYNLTDLFEMFAARLDLNHEVKHAILRCAGLDESMVTNLVG